MTTRLPLPDWIAAALDDIGTEGIDYTVSVVTTTRSDPFHLIDAEAPQHSAQWEEFSATPGSEERNAYGF